MAAPLHVFRNVLLLLILVGLVSIAVVLFRNSTAWNSYHLPTFDNKLFIRRALATGRDPISKDIEFESETESSSRPLATESSYDELKRYFAQKPKIDDTFHRSEVEEVQRQNPNLPIAFWNDHKNMRMQRNENCAKLPNIFDLSYNNRYWQTLHTSNGTFRLYGAYYERRKLSKLKPIVRILGVLNRIEPTVKTYCQLWFTNLNIPVFGKVLEYHFVWLGEWGRYQQGLYQPYLIACEIPAEFHDYVPAAVSLVEKPCDMASNSLRVIYDNPGKKKDFVVCVKGLDFPYVDLSVRLVEWIEVVRTLGADKIVFYEFDVHPNISKVLKYYQELGLVEIKPHSLPAGEPNLPGLQHLYLANRVAIKNQLEIIPYNDCFYKNMYAYRYVILLDTDEVIIPERVSTWKELMNIVETNALAEKKEAQDVYSARNVYFFDDYPKKLGWFKDIPKYMYILQHAYRTKNFTLPFHYVKSFFNTETALGLNNHYTFTCLNNCNTYEIPISEAKLQHYRADCVPDLQRVCGEYRKNWMKDTSIWKIKDQVIEGTITTLKKLGFFKLKESSYQ